MKAEEKDILIKRFIDELRKYENVIMMTALHNGQWWKSYVNKTIATISADEELLQCSHSSLIGSIIYFAQLGLFFNTAEGYGYIDVQMSNNKRYASPIVGYKGLVEIAYRNPSLQRLQIQAVYKNDEFDYEYGTEQTLKHKPPLIGARGELTHVYALAQIQNRGLMFTVVHKEELVKIQKLSKSAKDKDSAYNSGIDVFNIMQAKVALKLLVKTLPKTGNEKLIEVLENDNKFDYEKAYRIYATENGYEIKEKIEKPSMLGNGNEVRQIEIKTSEKFKEKREKQ